MFGTSETQSRPPPDEGTSYDERKGHARAREASLREAIARLNAATAEVVGLVGSIEATQSWGDHIGCLSATHFLSWQCGVGRRDASRWVAVANKLKALPATSGAFSSGKLSLTQTEAIARVATPATDSSYLHWASLITAGQLERLTRTARRCKSLQSQKADEQRRERFLYTNFDDDGSYRLSGRLEAAAGAVVDLALNRAQDQLYKDATRNQEPALEESWGARRADALQHLAESALASTGTRTGGDATQVVLHLTPDMLTKEPQDSGDSDAGDSEPGPDDSSRCDLVPGVGLSRDTARRLACDCSLVALLEDHDGNPLNIARKARTIPPAIRRALNARDSCCVWPGCDRTRFLDAHHLDFWGDGGETSIGNLGNLCRWHHPLVHEGDFELRRQPDGRFVVLDPFGVPLPGSPEPLAASGSLVERQKERGLAIDDQTCRPDWDGSPLDTYALDVIIASTQDLEARAGPDG